MTVDEDVEAVVRAIQTLMAECRNPTFSWLLARVHFPRGVCTPHRLRNVLRRGMKSGRLVGPGSGRSTGYRFRTTTPPASTKVPKKEELSSIFGVILRPKAGSPIFIGKTLQNVRVLAYREPLRVIESGLAKAPWSEELVRVVRCETTIGGKSVVLGWFFAR